MILAVSAPVTLNINAETWPVRAGGTRVMDADAKLAERTMSTRANRQRSRVRVLRRPLGSKHWADIF